MEPYKTPQSKRRQKRKEEQKPNSKRVALSLTAWIIALNVPDISTPIKTHHQPGQESKI